GCDMEAQVVDRNPLDANLWREQYCIYDQRKPKQQQPTGFGGAKPRRSRNLPPPSEGARYRGWRFDARFCFRCRRHSSLTESAKIVTLRDQKNPADCLSALDVSVGCAGLR